MEYLLIVLALLTFGFLLWRKKNSSRPRPAGGSGDGRPGFGDRNEP